MRKSNKVSYILYNKPVIPLPKKINDHKYGTEPNTFGLTDVIVKKEHRKFKKVQYPYNKLGIIK